MCGAAGQYKDDGQGGGFTPHGLSAFAGVWVVWRYAVPSVFLVAFAMGESGGTSVVPPQLAHAGCLLPCRHRL